MLSKLGIALGAGMAAALLFSVTAKGTAISIALAYLAPLPIMIAAIGWGIDAGALSSLVAAGVVALVINFGSGGVADPASALIFWLTVALPGAVLAAVAVATSFNPFDGAPVNAQSKRAGLGVLAMTAAGFGALVSGGALAAMIVMNGGYANAVVAFRQMLEPTIMDALRDSAALPEELGADELARLIIRYAPAAIAASTTLMLILNLYVAARVTQLSQRLPRAWLDIPTQLRLPAPLGAVAIAAAVGWLFLPEPYNPFVAALAAPLALIFAFQGLAVLHALSRRAPGRIALMFALYLAIFLAPRWVGPALAIIGLVESVASLRARQSAKPFQR